VTVKFGEGEKVKFPTPPEPEKVKSQTPKSLEMLPIEPDKVVTTKERKEKANEPASLSPQDLKRLGLTPGSRAWNDLLGMSEIVEPEQADHTPEG
jgi:hypothetical protein